ncbi:L-lysine 6-transaminase [Halpernia frigidisoli]|uniref:L-lysine-epsilon aminotransferase n=1 Tax=Halpernia frigidisoli TaxID=1125876 RepID=A0A1I3CTJ1_9FLAO|nr:L-lysine 6-transaminase [Halpernia frigidisoli]SFH77658.1 L-lysine 6-transaminase precursor [Halpernia frigidisoli]
MNDAIASYPQKTNTVKEILGKHMLADGFDFIMDFEKSHGSYIYDSFTQSEYLDMFSMFASTAIGYNHPYVKEKSAWLGNLVVNKPTLADVYSQEYADFMEVFERVLIPKELQYCFFISGGALAVENAMKAAFDWKTRKNFEKNIDKEAGICVHFRQAFHGRSGYTLSLTNTADPRKHQYFPKFNWPRIENPKQYFPIDEASLAKTMKYENVAISEIKKAILEKPNEIACIIIEPIQAEGGDNHFRDEFFVELRKICDENEILLIFDEVQTGVGLTGKMWAFEHFSVSPDIISFGKKTQVCGILANREKLDQIPNNVFKESSRINSTFGGNWADMLRLQLILEVIEKENLVENARNMGVFLLDGLIKIEQKFPILITNARGRGLMCAFDLPTPELRNALQKVLYDHKLIVLTCGTQSIRFRPHLNVSSEDLQKALNIIENVLETM